MIIGCYVLTLYCDETGCPCSKYGPGGYAPAQYYAETGSKCRANARRDGWLVDLKRNRCLCPQCHERRKLRRRR